LIKGLELAKKGANQIIEIQRKALRQKFEVQK